jgi:NAD(P)H-flavin reductase
MSATTIPNAIGLVKIGKTTYEVVRYDVGPASEQDGVRNMLGLFGPRGSAFLVVDRGPEWLLTVARTTGNTVPRSRVLPELTRAHLAAFGVEG